MFEGYRFGRAIQAALAVLVLSASLAAATSKIAGTVRDAKTGEVLPQANVVLVDTKMGTASDAKGRFFILNVPPGVYTLRATYIGYNAYVLENVQVSADLTTEADVRMTSAEIKVEEVVIRAEKPIVDKNATNAVRIVSASDLEIMPFRGVRDAFALQAGVVEDEGALHVRGSRSDEIGYYVEGANARNVVTGNSAVGLIDEALAEVQLQAGGFNAEYGGANAGIMLHELRTGGAQWRFTLSGESDGFTSNFKKRLGTFSYGYGNQVLTASGPLLSQKNRAFVAVQRSVQDSDPTFWSGFDFVNGQDGMVLADNGDAGGQVHWQKDADGNAIPDTVRELRMRPGNIDHTAIEQIDVNGTLLFDYNPLQVRVSGLYTTGTQEYNPAPVRNMLNPLRLPEGNRGASLINVKGTHLLDPSLFYEVNFSLYDQTRERYGDPRMKDQWWVYNDSVAVERTWGTSGYYTPYTANGQIPRAYNFYGFAFNRPGAPTSHATGESRTTWYTYDKDSYWGVAGSVTKQTTVHQIKAGFDYQAWTSRRFSLTENSLRAAIKSTYPQLDAVYQRYYRNEITADQILDELLKKAATLPDGQGSTSDLKRMVRINASSDFFGYDEFGRLSDDPSDPLQAPRKPVLGSAYVQDKIEYKDLVMNAGVRYEYFYADSWRILDDPNYPGTVKPKRDPTNFTMVISDSAGTYMAKTRKFHEFSPRLGFSFPVSDRTVFHTQYGRFSQMPAMRDLFTGGAMLAIELGGQNYIQYPTAFDIEPIRTTQYEIGFEQQFTDFASFDMTGFYRDVKGQLQIRRAALSPNAVDVGAYSFYQNGDFATTKGLEFVVKLRRINRIRAEMNYTLSDARGTGSSENEAIAGVNEDTELPTIISPLDFNETHRGNMYVDYRFGANEGGSILRNAGANLMFSFTSGHNYTLATGSIGQRDADEGGILADDDPRSRKPLESINASSTPWTFELDLRVDKGFSLMGTEATAFVYVQNLLNRKNVINVYDRTGNAEDDGFLTNPDLSSQIVASQGGQNYTELYRAINLNNRQHYWKDQTGDLFGEPRQIRFGLKFAL